MDNNYTVYKHTAPNGKVYIGITSIKPEYRWNNGKGYEHQKLFYRAINKYGWNNLKHEILFENLSKKLACKMEQDLIKFYKSNNPQYGYNNTIGGDVGTLGAKLSKETREKMSKSRTGILHPMYGIPRSEETKLRISKSRAGKCKGAENYNFGKHLSEETKVKISSSKIGKPNYKLRGRKLSAEHIKHISESHKGLISGNKGNHYKKSKESVERSALNHMKKILCIETKEIFNSIKEAAEIKKIDTSSLTKVCKGKRKTAGGYHWEYIEET